MTNIEHYKKLLILLEKENIKVQNILWTYINKLNNKLVCWYETSLKSASGYKHHFKILEWSIQAF